MTRRMAMVIAAFLCSGAGTAAAQVRPFLYTVVPARGQVARSGIYGDVAYGHNLFAGLGAEGLEQRLAVQLPLTARLRFTAQVGWAPTTPNNATIQGEVLADLAPASARTTLAFGIGGMHDYRRTSVALGRVVAGYRWAKTVAVANVRLEHAFPKAGSAEQRDALDIITTLGVMHDVRPSVRLGVESVAEDLEGFFEADEAEGGAKLMVGPSIGLGPRAARWTLQVTAGPVFRLTQSTAAVGSGAPRDLTTGFVVRTSLGLQW